MSETPFLRDQWYIVAAAGEITQAPLARVICDEPVVIFRGADGKAGVLSDRCPHRKAPLSSGDVVGNDLRCGYHGITFARDGSCARIPGDLPAPRGFRARSFPAIERHGFIFMWPGEGAPDESLLPDFFENDDPAWTPVPGYLHIKANYELMVDNILDLTHVVFVHKTTLAGGGVTETPLEVEVKGDRIFARRMMFNVDTAPIYKAAKGLHGKIDRWQIFEWQPPSFVKVILGAREAGSTAESEGQPTHVVVNGFTPETGNTLHYFWSTSRPWALGDPKVSDLYRTMIDLAFREDMSIVERQQRLIDTDKSGTPLMAFPFDRSGVGARRIVRRLLDAEATRRSTHAAE
jgi:phenylpropionate dioxygenase-like ring-hydroxylating dioxygenase large terminal subunit